MKLKNFQFGFADAEKEFNRIPDIFKESFYDPNEIVEKLINRHQFLLVGRKGVGKSAVISKIRYNSEYEDDLFTFALQLNDFEYSTFSKTNSDQDSIGTQKYKESWQFVLLITIIKIMYNDLRMTSNPELANLVEFLEETGFFITKKSSHKKNITRLSKIKVGSPVVKLDLEFEKEFGSKPTNFSERISLLNEMMMDVIEDVFLNEKRISIVIDGVDDILRFKKQQLNILSSLIRSVDYLNESFFSISKDIKIILCIREDILSSITDPDLNKIKRDSSIAIEWGNNNDGLKEVVKRRFVYSGLDSSESTDYWNYIFPKKVRGKDSWEYVQQFTLYKPRDILQFLKICQELYPEEQSIGFRDIHTAVKRYSKDYFIEEMKNEVTGFVNDDVITLLPSVFQKIGDSKFTLQQFVSHYNNQGENKKEEDLRLLLVLLYEAGYVGQLLVNHGKRGRVNHSVIFKYRNPNSQVDMSGTFIIHQGIKAGLGIKLE